MVHLQTRCAPHLPRLVHFRPGYSQPWTCECVGAGLRAEASFAWHLVSCERRPAAVRIDRIGRVFPLGAFVDDARPSPSKFTIMAAACKPNRCRRFSEACGQDHGDGNVGNSLLWRAESTVIPRRSHTRGHKLEFDFDVCTVIGSLRSLRPPCGVLFDRQLWGPQKPKVRKFVHIASSFLQHTQPVQTSSAKRQPPINPFRAVETTVTRIIIIISLRA